MLKSVDGGQTWTNFVELGTAQSVRDIKVDTSGPNDIVLVTTDIGLFRSTDGGITYNQPEQPAKVTPGDVARSTVGPEQLAQPDLLTALNAGSVTIQSLSGATLSGGAAFRHDPDPNWSPWTDPYYKDHKETWPVIYDAQSRGEADDKMDNYQHMAYSMTALQNSSNTLLKTTGDFSGLIDYWGWLTVPEIEGEGLLSKALRTGVNSTLAQLPIEAVASSSDPLRPNGSMISNMVSNFTVMSAFGLIEGSLGKLFGEGIDRPSLFDREVPASTNPAEKPFIGTDLGDAYDERQVLAPGMVVVLEPIAWDDGTGGYRSEEIVVITDEGYERLTNYPYAPYGD